MKLPRLAATIVAVLLTACGLPKPAPERSLFDLGQTAGDAAGAPPMRVDVMLPAWLDTADIAYRLDYEEPARLRHYAGSRWAGRPSQMVAARLSSRFAAGTAKCVLRVEVEEFAQHYGSAAASTQQLSGRWLVTTTTGQRLAGEALRLAEPAGVDAASGVKAAGRIVDRLADELRNAAGKIPACSA